MRSRDVWSGGRHKVTCRFDQVLFVGFDELGRSGSDFLLSKKPVIVTPGSQPVNAIVVKSHE